MPKTSRCWWLVGLVVVSDGWWGKIVVAQTVPLPAPQIPQPQLSPQPESPNPLLLTPESPTPQYPELEPSSDTIKVERFVFVGNTVFSDRELETVVAPYTGKDLTWTEIQMARDAISNFYTERGYITSGAFIPLEENQGIASGAGIVTIQIVEGKLEAINVEGSKRLANYVRSRIPTGVVNRARLVEALSWLHVDPSIEKISAILVAGSQPGLSQLNVEVKPKDPLKVAAIADNYRSPTAGSFERGLELNNANLLGRGDDFSLDYRNTDGSNYLGVNYKLPINPQNGTIEVGYSQLDSDIIERPFNQLDIVSAQRNYQLTVRQPIRRKLNCHKRRLSWRRA
jgi:hemolysin activation/secretion protein